MVEDKVLSVFLLCSASSENVFIGRMTPQQNKCSVKKEGGGAWL
jgi:hypothetical protein